MEPTKRYSIQFELRHHLTGAVARRSHVVVNAADDDLMTLGVAAWNLIDGEGADPTAYHEVVILSSVELDEKGSPIESTRKGGADETAK